MFALKLARVNNKSVGLALQKLGVVRPVDIPETLFDRRIMNAWQQLLVLPRTPPPLYSWHNVCGVVNGGAVCMK
jgi:hypothetical protein